MNKSARRSHRSPIPEKWCSTCGQARRLSYHIIGGLPLDVHDKVLLTRRIGRCPQLRINVIAIDLTAHMCECLLHIIEVVVRLGS